VNVGRDSIRMRFELTSPRRAADKLKFLAGTEAAMNAWSAEILPEDTAARLRDAIDTIPAL
jgi:UDPglucose--hexose-1-phosphate uridylyltransferase